MQAGGRLDSYSVLLSRILEMSPHLYTLEAMLPPLLFACATKGLRLITIIVLCTVSQHFVAETKPF